MTDRPGVLPVRMPGRTAGAFQSGWNLIGAGEIGGEGFDDFLARRVRPGLPVESAYRWRG